MCQTGLRVNSSSISMLGDPAKGKIFHSVHSSGDIISFKNKTKSPDKTGTALLFAAKTHRATRVSYQRNCICLDQGRSSVFLLSPQADEGSEDLPQQVYCLFSSPFQAFFLC